MSPKTKEQYAVIRSKSEEKILDAALELFVSKGYKAASISSIANQAGISKGLMYNYFDSKTDLLRTIVSQALAIGTKIFNEVLKEYESPQEELEHLVLSITDHVKTHTHYWHLLTALSFQPEVMKEVEDLIETTTQWSLQKSTEIFQKMGSSDPLADALLFNASVDGMLMHYIHMKDQYPIDSISQKLIATYSNLVALTKSK